MKTQLTEITGKMKPFFKFIFLSDRLTSYFGKMWVIKNGIHEFSLWDWFVLTVCFELVNVRCIFSFKLLPTGFFDGDICRKYVLRHASTRFFTLLNSAKELKKWQLTPPAHMPEPNIA